MFSRKSIALFTAAAVVGAVSAAHASVVQLSVTASGGTYSVYATFTDITSTIATGKQIAGLADYTINVNGTGGISVLSGNPVAPGIISGSNYAFGPGINDSGIVSGTNVTNIDASQNVVYGGSYNASKNKFVVLGLGMSSGTLPDGSETYANPLLIAQGTYSGSAGSLTAVVTPGGSFQALQDTAAVGSTVAWTGPGKVENASAVNPGVFTFSSGPTFSVGAVTSPTTTITGNNVSYKAAVLGANGSFTMGGTPAGNILVALDLSGQASYTNFFGSSLPAGDTDVSAQYASLFTGLLGGSYDVVISIPATQSGTVTIGGLPAGVTLNSIAVVPEPTSLAGLALLGVPALARRRRA